jgi:hypothetical protein
MCEENDSTELGETYGLALLPQVEDAPHAKQVLLERAVLVPALASTVLAQLLQQGCATQYHQGGWWTRKKKTSVSTAHLAAWGRTGAAPQSTGVGHVRARAPSSQRQVPLPPRPLRSSVLPSSCKYGGSADVSIYFYFFISFPKGGDRSSRHDSIPDLAEATIGSRKGPYAIEIDLVLRPS